MTNLSAVLHNLLDAIDGGDMDEIKSAAKLAKMAAPTPDTEDSGGSLTPGQWYVYDADNADGPKKRIILCKSETEAIELWPQLDALPDDGNWYAAQWDGMPDVPITTETEVRANAG
jgi:hypothetical protein